MVALLVIYALNIKLKNAKGKRSILIKSDLSKPLGALWAGNINKYDIIDINQMIMTLVPLRVS